LIVSGAVSVWWLSRYTLAVRRLTRGVGDTMFYSADGRPWFRLDEQRHDVPLAQISPDLQHAVVAIEDRRFFYHPGIDPVGIARAIAHDVRARRSDPRICLQQMSRCRQAGSRRATAGSTLCIGADTKVDDGVGTSESGVAIGPVRHRGRGEGRAGRHANPDLSRVPPP